VVHMRTQWEDTESLLQTRKSSFTRHRICWNLNLRLPSHQCNEE
jgi:hypothetical protein